MDDPAPSIGTPSRLLAEETVLRAILDVLDKTMPGSSGLVFDRAHARLSTMGPRVPEEHAFFAGAHAAIDQIMHVPTPAEISANRRAEQLAAEESDNHGTKAANAA